jgi:hypothetical protein
MMALTSLNILKTSNGEGNMVTQTRNLAMFFAVTTKVQLSGSFVKSDSWILATFLWTEKKGFTTSLFDL